MKPVPTGMKIVVIAVLFAFMSFAPADGTPVANKEDALQRKPRALEYGVETEPAAPEYNEANNYPDTDNYDPKVLQQWMNFAFIYSFVKYPASYEDDARAAAAIYDQVKDSSYEDSAVYSTLAQNVTLLRMKSLVNKAFLGRLISRGEHNAQINLLSSTYSNSSTKFLKTIREHVFASGNVSGEVIYGITGFLQLSKKGGVVRGTLLNAFRKFKLNIPLTPGQLRYSRGRECILWETFCKSNIHRLGNLERSQVAGVLTYMRDETLAQFKDRYEPIVSRVGWEAYKSMDYLPIGVKNSVGAVIAAGDQRPDQVLGESQLHGHLYDL